MIRRFIEKRAFKKLKKEMIKGVDMDIKEILNDFTDEVSEHDALLKVEQLKIMVRHRKYLEDY